jgi:PAS domain S-box-containing protein
MARFLSKDFRKDPLSSQYGSIKKPGILIILAGCFIMLVVVLTWFALDRVKEKIQTDVGEALQIVLQTTHESLNLWVESNKFNLSQLAEDPRLITLTERQLRVPRDTNSLLISETLKELRAFFGYRKNQFGQAGFFIIAPDFINIASMRDGNIGAKNLIASQALDLINKAFQGEAVMVPPIWSDVTLSPTPEGKTGTFPTMFFAAPIKNRQGNVIAVVTQLIDPARDFTRIIQLGRIGKSGETYAFDLYGKLLSESRFEEDLIKTGLIKEGQKSILKVIVRDPGGDMTKGFTPSVPRYQQPLTLMAREATQGKAGFNVTGYRDYRGVRAYGAWLWDDTLGIGLSTEIDAADALGPYYTTRTVILTVLGITVLLALGSLVFAVLIDVRANRALQKSHDELELRVEERTAELRKLSQATENSPVSVVVTDKNGTIEYVNPTFSEITGYSADEAIGRNPSVLKSGDLPDSYYKELWDTILSGKVWKGEFKNKRKNGEKFWESASISPIKNEEGEITHFVAVKEDITEQKKIRESLRERELQLRTIFEKSPLGILHFGKDGIVLECNDRHAELMGSTREEIIGMNLREEIKNEEVRAAVFGALAGEQTEFEGEYTSVSGGRTIVVRSVFSPTEPGTSPTEVINTTEDITERKQAEEAIHESRERLDTILKTTAQGFCLNDQDDNIMEANEAMCQILGLGKEEIVGSNFFDFLDEKNREIVREQNRMRKKGTHSFYEISLIRADGQRVPCLMNASPLFDKDGNVVGSFGMTTNIAERKQMEEELRKNVDELERFSKVAYGREKKMIQLKQEINELMIQQGQDEKYKIVK